jgi:hypothetical protein
MLFALTFLVPLLAPLPGCANNPAAKLEPVAKVAYYGERFMAGVEEAQNQTIALVGQFGITRADVTPAVEVFLQIGRGGQDLAAGLKIIDESTAFDTQQAAAVRVRLAADTFTSLLTTVTARVTHEGARTRIAQILSTVKLGVALLDVVQRLGPFLPQTQPALIKGEAEYSGYLATRTLLVGGVR